jgi:hypothetical protein
MGGNRGQVGRWIVTPTAKTPNLAGAFKITYLAGQRMMLAEVEAVANQLGPLSSQRLRAWVADRRADLAREEVPA